MQQIRPNHSRNVPKVPKVTIVNIGEIGYQQDYSDIDIVHTDDININTPLFFNNAIQNNQSNLYLFLPSSFQFAQTNTVSRMVSILQQYSMYGGVYTDHYIIRKYKLRNYLPAFDRELLSSGIIINTPVLLYKHCLVPFHQNIKSYFLYQLLLLSSYKYVLYHIAEPLFTLTQQDNISKDKAMEDLQLIKQIQPK